MGAGRPAWVLRVAPVGLLLSLLVTADASAYCRSSTTTEPTGQCEEKDDAVFLEWKRSCLTYAFDSRFFDRQESLDESEVRRIVAASFSTWTDVTCDGSAFHVTADTALTNSDPVGFVFDERNTSVMSALTNEEWTDLKQPPSAFAITFLWHNKRTGEIYDVDMALNLRHGPFTDCADGCRNGRVDLQNTITHEAGHVFGLGHSSVSESTMQFDARAGETFMRDLEPDDEQGLCALALPGHDCAADDSSCSCPPAPIIPAVLRVGRGCSLARPAARHTPMGLLALLGLATTRRYRRYTRRRR